MSSCMFSRACACAAAPKVGTRFTRRQVRASSHRGAKVWTTAADEIDSSDEDVSSASSWSDDDTIVAIATPVVPSSGGVAVIRLSGPNAVQASRAVFRPASKQERDSAKKGNPLQSHVALYGTVRDPTDDSVIDEVLLLPMLAPRSYTAEDVVEIHCHGGTVCVQRVLSLILRNGERVTGSETSENSHSQSRSVRLARPGEFTLRAFLNGRLDLTQAEAVHQLVTARSTQAADGALSALRGGLAGPVKKARCETIDLLAELEARLDFDDELEPLDEVRIASKVTQLKSAIEQILSTANKGRLQTTGISVAIVGRPNAGKSSLLNLWSKTDRAIVTSIAGTTRDIVEADIFINGIPVTLLDTAGIRSDTQGDMVEAIGVERSVAAAAGADAVVLVVDAKRGWREEDTRVWASVVGGGGEENHAAGGDTPDKSATIVSGANSTDEFENARQRLYAVRGGLEGFQNDFKNEGDTLRLEQSTAEASTSGRNDARSIPLILALNKIDEVGVGSANDDGTDNSSEDVASAAERSVPDKVLSSCHAVVRTSAVARLGIDELEKSIAQAVGAGDIQAEGSAWAANQRQASALRTAVDALERLEETIDANLPVDFWTIELREVAAALGEITGEEVAEDVLDVVFTKFCIGK